VSSGPGSQTTVFEITVIGGLCASLEAALAPGVSHGLRATTVVRLCRDEGDLVAAYGRLVRVGFEVEDIVRVD
jgi:hypothetical protein